MTKQRKEALRQVLKKHFKHPDKLELNDAYIVLFQDLVKFMRNADKKVVENGECVICKGVVKPNKQGKVRKTCNDKCKSELFSRNATRMVKEGRVPNQYEF